MHHGRNNRAHISRQERKEHMKICRYLTGILFGMGCLLMLGDDRAWGISNTEMFEDAIRQIAHGEVDAGMSRIRYLCERMRYTDACDFLKNTSNQYGSRNARGASLQPVSRPSSREESNTQMFEDALAQIERGETDAGMSRMRYLCERRYNTEACDYLKKPLRIGESPSVKQSPVRKSTPAQATSSARPTLDDGFKFYQEKKYYQAYPIFKQYCREEQLDDACLMYGISEMYGHGTVRSPSGAMRIFNMPILKDNPNAEIRKAEIYEYSYGSSSDIVGAMSIYRRLENSHISYVAKWAKEGLERKPVYEFLERVCRPVTAFYNDKIKYDQLERALMNVNTRELPPKLEQLYYSWRLPLLKLAANKTTWGDSLWLIGKSAVKGFIGDYSFLGDVWDAWNKDEKMKPLISEVNLYERLMIEELKNLEISAKFWNSVTK